MIKPQLNMRKFPRQLFTSIPVLLVFIGSTISSENMNSTELTESTVQEYGKDVYSYRDIPKQMLSHGAQHSYTEFPQTSKILSSNNIYPFSPDPVDRHDSTKIIYNYYRKDCDRTGPTIIFGLVSFLAGVASFGLLQNFQSEYNSTIVK